MAERTAGGADAAKSRGIVASFIAHPSTRWIVLSLVTAAIIGTAAYSYREIDTELTTVALLRREAVAQLAAATLSEKFGRLVDVAISLSTRVRFRNLVTQGKWDEAIEIMRDIPRDLPHIERLFLTDVRGTLRADIPPLPKTHGVNFAFREWYRGVSREWRPYVSPVYTRTAAPLINVFAVAVPVKNTDGNVAGILVLQIRIANLTGWIQAIDTGPEGSIYVVDSKEQVVFDSRHQKREEVVKFSKQSVMEKLRLGEHGVETGFDPTESEDIIVAYAPVPSYGWSIVAQQPLRASRGFAARDEQLRRLLTGYGLILLLGAATVLLASRIVIERQRAEDDRRMRAELERHVVGRTEELGRANETLRTEIAERTQAEDKFRNLLESAPDSIVLVDREGRVALVNSQAERCFGYTREELIGQPIEILVPERSRPNHPGYREKYTAAPQTRPMGLGLDLYGRRKNGSEFPVDISLSPLETAEGTLVTAIVRDVTARRHAEQRFRAVAETANDAVVSADSSGNIVYLNPAAERIFGYTSAETLGRPLTLLMPERFHAAHREGLRRFLAGGEARVVGKTVELAGRRRDGTEFPLDLSLSSWKVGGEVFFTGILRDISARKSAEEALRNNIAQLAAANKELEAFSYSVSHDLRAPLRSIDGFSQALLDDSADRLDESGRQHLARVRAATARMGVLIDDLLQISRVMRAEIHREAVDLSALADAVAAELRHTEPRRQVEIAIQPGLQAEGDAKLLRIALVNLLSNAWKFTGLQPAARVELGALDNGNERAFFVRDNGVGFDMAYAGKLFGAFQRLHAANEFPGTGIGLATVQRIIHRHGGRVWAEGAVNRGATFYFTLPQSAHAAEVK